MLMNYNEIQWSKQRKDMLDFKQSLVNSHQKQNMFINHQKHTNILNYTTI